MDIREVIFTALGRIAEEQNIVFDPPLSRASVLLESGLDSLGFAILVSELESLLGYDPFVLMESPVYPRTLGEFIAIYEQYRGHLKLAS